jgi:hypothetical protein
MPELVELIKEFLQAVFGISVDPAAFIGVAALVALAVNVLKYFEVIPDNWGGIIAGATDLIVIVVAVVAGYFDVDLASIDGILLMVAQIITAALALFGITFGIHKLGRAAKVPFFGPRK